MGNPSRISEDDLHRTALVAPRVATAIVVASDASPGLRQMRGPYVWHCDGTDDYVQIQAAIDACADLAGDDSQGKVVGTEGTFALGSTGITIPNAGGNDRDTHFEFDFSAALITYSGTGTAVTAGLVTSFMSRLAVKIGELQATGAAIASSSAVGISWTGFSNELDAWVSEFHAGKGLVLVDTNSGWFPHLRFTNCKIGITTAGDAGGNLFGMVDYRVISGSGVASGVALQDTGTGVGYASCAFGFFNACWYESGDWTIVDIDQFDYRFQINQLTAEYDAGETGDTILADFNIGAGAALGCLLVGHCNVNSGGGQRVVTGDAVNIRAIGSGGKNAYPPTIWNPCHVGHYATGNAADAIDTGDGRQAPDSVRFHTFTDDATTAVLVKGLRPSPGSPITFQFACKSSVADVKIEPRFAQYDNADAAKGMIGSCKFKVPALDTWYLVTVPAVTQTVERDVYKGSMEFAISNPGGGEDVNISEIACFVQTTSDAYIESEGTAAAVADGGTIAHGLATTVAPAFVSVVGSVANEVVAVTGLDGTNITVSIKKTTDQSAGTAQTIYWRARM